MKLESNLVSQCSGDVNGAPRNGAVKERKITARAAPGKPIRVRAAPEVIRWIDNQGERLRAALARRGAANLAFEQDATCSREGFDVTTLP